MYSIGLDVSKSTINVYIPIKDQDLVIDNNLKSIKALYSKLKKYYKKEIDKLVFIFEPTGNYSSVLKYFCSEKDIKCFIVNPKQSSNFSKALGERNKSDLTDARVLSKMQSIALDGEIKVPVIDRLVEEINELISFYKLILKQKLQNSNHLEALLAKSESSIVIKKVKREISNLEKTEQEVIDKIIELIKEDEKLYQAFNNIKTVKGLGELSAIVLLHHFIRYPDTNQREIISLAGLDPITKESGTSLKKKTKISKAGSKICRSTLFMATIVATQCNEEMKVFYNRLKENGKHTTVAQIAVMRKLIVIAHSLYKNNQTYDPLKYKSN